MISSLIGWLANPNRKYRPAITYPRNTVPRTLVIAQQRWAVDQWFSSQDSFTYKKNLRVGTSMKGMTINYRVQNCIDFLGDPREGEIHEVVKFKNCWVPFFPSDQFILDFLRCFDYRVIGEGDSAVRVPIPSTEITLNGKKLKWHHRRDPRLSVSNRHFVTAPVLLEQLRGALADDRDRLYLLLSILTQSSMNDMFKTIQAHIKARWDVLVTLSSTDDGCHNYRGYHINVTKEGICTVRAMIAGYFSGCCDTVNYRMVPRQPNKEIGSFRCTTEYSLDTKEASFSSTFILLPENWKS